MYERALERAASALTGPFAGVPIVLKDMGSAVKGMRQHQRNQLVRRLDWRAGATTPLLERILAAGFVPVGKSNVPEFGAGATTQPLAYGPTRKPWDLTRSTSGSSGGSAAAVASGMFRAWGLLAAFGGLRRGELLALTPTRPRLLHRTVRVRVQRQETRDGMHHVGPPKTDAGRRTLVLSTAILPDLDHHLHQWAGSGRDGLIFPEVLGRPLRLRVWQREWTRARRTVGLEHVHLHDLRHVAATMAATTTEATMKELMHRLGHASPAAALRYQHATAKRDEAIADGIDRLLATADLRPRPTVAEFDESGRAQARG